MKQLYLLLLFFAVSFGLNAQAVSINTDGSPPNQSALLDVKSTTKGVLFPRMTKQQRTNIPNPAEGLIVWDINSNSLWGFDGNDWQDITSKWEYSGSNIVNSNNGTVGIGDAISGADLYISKPNPDIWFYDTGRPATSGTIEGDTNNLHIHASRALWPLITTDPGDLVLQRDESFGQFGTYRAGNVGIGIDNPPYKLTLDGTMGFYDGPTRYGLVSPYEGDMLLNAKFGSLTGAPKRNLLLQTSTVAPPFDYSGRVGIGTLDPQAKLHVNGSVLIGTGIPADDYLLSINGRIMAEEMRIEDSAGWPDYVFEADYDLSTLDQLAQDIDHLGHLPGIPSASTSEADGMPGK